MIKTHQRHAIVIKVHYACNQCGKEFKGLLGFYRHPKSHTIQIEHGRCKHCHESNNIPYIPPMEPMSGDLPFTYYVELIEKYRGPKNSATLYYQRLKDVVRQPRINVRHMQQTERTRCLSLSRNGSSLITLTPAPALPYTAPIKQKLSNHPSSCFAPPTGRGGFFFVLYRTQKER